nr:hypothetical protein [Tanacetum cinerariifolium]
MKFEQKFKLLKHAQLWFAIISDCNLVFILKASIPTKRKLDLTTGIYFLGNRSSQFCKNRSKRLLRIRSSQFSSNRSSKALRTMATIIEQQVAMDEALIPSTQRLRIGRSNFRLPSDIQSKESTLQLVYDVLRRCPFFKAFPVTADVPEIYMIPRQSFDELPFEEEILDFIRDDFLFLMIKVVSRHQNTQQYGAMLPIELTNDEIRNTKAYKEYYAFATGEAAPKPKASTDEGTSSKPGVPDVPTDKSEEELSWNSSDDESADDQEKDGDDDEGDEEDKSRDDKEESESDEEDDNEETMDEESFDPIPKTPKSSEDEGDDEEDQGESDEEETRQEEEESFEPIPRTPEESENESNDEEDQELRLSEEARIQEEEDADELYQIEVIGNILLRV